MIDFLDIIVKGDLLTSFARMFEVIIVLDLFASCCAFLGNAGEAVS